MTYDKARQRKDGTWAYTSMNDGEVWAIGYCEPFREWSDESIDSIYGDRGIYDCFFEPYRATKEKHHEGGHATKEEACECYKQYVLDHKLVYAVPEEDLRECDYPECKLAGVCEMGIPIGPQRFVLCAHHMSKEHISSLISIGECWHS
jgi:hypothetical protein